MSIEASEAGPPSRRIYPHGLGKPTTAAHPVISNRRNALRSTGPKTEYGKQRSRAKAVRHGLTAETAVGSLEDAEDYKAFEAAIISDYCAETAVAREVVLRGNGQIFGV